MPIDAQVEAAAKALYASEYDIEAYPWESAPLINREGYRRSARALVEQVRTAEKYVGYAQSGDGRGHCGGDEIHHAGLDSVEARAPEAEIEITPAMTEAGLLAFSEYDDRFEGEEEAVANIYRAMVMAKRPSLIGKLMPHVPRR